MILLIDNYDSFTYNLYQYIGTFTPDIRVVRNDAITIGEKICSRSALCFHRDLKAQKRRESAWMS